MRRRTPPVPPKVSDEDAALFREAIGTVRRIEATPAAAAPRPPPRARQREQDEAEALATSRQQPFADPGSLAAESVQFRRDGLGERIWRKLRRGQFAVQDEIDLHQQSAVAAESMLRAFLFDARAHDHLCVRVIHGKGLHSKAGTPVLGGLVETQLRRRSEVLAFCSAPPSMGGTGAVLVLLRRRRPGEAIAPDRASEP